MIILSKLFFVKSLIFPRAGNLINQTQNNKFFMSLIKFLFNKADFFLCQGPVWYKYATNDLKINQARVDIINNWTATDELIQVGKKRLINNNNSLEILFIGWLEKEKGINELIRVFHKLQKHYQIKIKFIGNGTLKKKIELYSVEHNLQNSLITTGWLNDEEIILHLKSADIFILPSWQEGMPNSLIEALASGLPSICSSVGAIPDYIIDNHNGLLIEPKNQFNLEKTLEKTIKDIDLRRKLSKNGVLLAEKQFSANTSLKKLVNIIKAI
jgi:glycosyltransferase involved in cell wall biosynthesis